MSLSPRSEQILLPFSRHDRYEFDSYIAGANGETVAYLLKTLKEESNKNIYLWGGQGVGKTHLLQAACHLAFVSERRYAYIPLRQIHEYTPDMLTGLEMLDLVCIDDVDKIAKNPEWESAAFHLFNHLREAETPLIMSSRLNPAGTLIDLPDLKSRLSWDLVFYLAPMNETMKMDALKQRANHRGFELSDEVIAYLIRRISRDTRSLFLWLDELDERSLIAKKKLTIPFVKQLLEEGE